ncbi:MULTISPECIES: nucleoside triphosphate pyrophosphatase [unclassified Neptuniibacter]|uniref:Maf family protein n=1 Tax=unclassified Neptuniibacter TaxID=2630693 RepID=UPI000C3BFAF4|nr:MULTISPECIES: nucleoside triphosphate pyrophosphatase [unclassified Neptuniibacter]MAY43566.1 septum formation inhibitor Maf [Oceanospirillaceae bacterium]|tara:strand:+ start:24498 stop:25076 length:579 start_codon:yes stop_codon:yes gene_type:complete
MRKLILASSSPFRRQILDKLQLEYSCISPDIDESAIEDEKPEDLVARLAVEKAQKIAETENDCLIIGSDQVAVLNNEILGKPHTHENAVAQLKKLSGHRVTFLTGLALINAKTGNIQSEIVPFYVEFRDLSDEVIENYLRAETPYNCAGSFKSEALGIVLFDKLEGEDPNTLMGLPLIRLVRLLENEGFNVL